jgi:hypothetical protein
MASVRTGAGRWIGRGVGRVVAIASLAITAVGATGTAEAQEQAPGSVRVVHGLRGLVADVYLDGALALPTFQPERSTEPLSVPAGDHLVEIRSGGAAATETPLLTQTVTVPAGFQGSLIAHLDRNGDPTLTAFADDLSVVPASQSRVTVRHAAAAEDVTVLLNDQPALTTPITSKSEAAQLLAAGSYQLAVAAASSGEVLAAPQPVEYADGTANFMYLIGSQAEQTLGWAVVRVDGLQSPPAMIQTGDGSAVRSADDDGGRAVLALLAVLAATGGAIAIRIHRRRADHMSTP